MAAAIVRTRSDRLWHQFGARVYGRASDSHDQRIELDV